MLHTSHILLLLTAQIKNDEVKIASKGIMLTAELVKIGSSVTELNGPTTLFLTKEKWNKHLISIVKTLQGI
jgi:hypothetical protein